MNNTIPQVYAAFFLCSCILISSSCKPDGSTTPEVVAQQKSVKEVPQSINTSPIEQPSTKKIGVIPSQDQEDFVVAEHVEQIPKAEQDKPNSQKNIKPRKPKKLAKIKFDLIRYDFGTIVEGDTVDYNFKFTNTGEAPLEIDSTKVTCGCTQPSYPFIPIEVGEQGFIGVRYVSVGKDGKQEPLITVYTNASTEPNTLMFTGKVISKEQDTLRQKKLVKDAITSKVDSLK